MKHSSAIVVTILLAACSAQTPAPATVQQPPPPSEPIAEAPKSDALAKADALIAEMRAREAAQAKRDRENPPPPPPRLDQFVPTAAPNAAPTTAATIAAPSPPTAVTDARGEQWWKEQARTLQIKVEEDTRLMEQARTAMLNSTLKITLDEAEREYRSRVAALQNSRAALARFRDDARRANVPAGWARWP